jgi:hypothetical protein
MNKSGRFLCAYAVQNRNVQSSAYSSKFFTAPINKMAPVEFSWIR